MMKRITIIVCLVICFIAVGFSMLSKGYDGVIKKVRQMVNDSDTEIERVWIEDSLVIDKRCLFWVIVQYKNNEYAYIPVEFEIVLDGYYMYIHLYKPIQRSENIACVLWANAYHFLINDELCSCLELKYKNNKDVRVDLNYYPYVYHSQQNLIEYHYLDSDYKDIY